MCLPAGLLALGKMLGTALTVGSSVKGLADADANKRQAERTAAEAKRKAEIEKNRQKRVRTVGQNTRATGDPVAGGAPAANAASPRHGLNPGRGLVQTALSTGLNIPRR